MESDEIERLARDLARDVQNGDISSVVITSDGKLNSISRVEFERLKEKLALLIPGVSVVHRSEG